MTKLMDLVATSRLFFPKISIFPDKLEGSLTALDEFLQPDMMARFDRLLNGLGSAGADRKGFGGDDGDAQLEHERKVDFETVFGPIPVCLNERDRTSLHIVEEQREWLFSQCWHIANSESESVAMWRMYGGESGVCIVSTVGRVLDNVDRMGKYKITAAKVEYRDQSEVLSWTRSGSDRHPLHQFAWKHRFYLAEGELRFIAYDPNSSLGNQNSEAGVRLPVNLSGLIQEVRVSPEAEKWVLESLRQLFVKLDLNIKVVQSAMLALSG